MIDAAFLQLCYGAEITPQRAATFAPFIDRVAADFEIDSAWRLATFLAQVGHESGCFRYMREIWGPTPAQARYEPVTSLSRQLGNTQPGDGYRFMGHGPIQTTGRANHRQAGLLLAKKYPDLRVPDFELDPEALATPLWGALAAGLFWDTRKLNGYADRRDFVGQTKRINGGINGLAHRQRLLAASLPACLLILG